MNPYGKFILELFTDDSGRASLTRLLSFFSFLPATWVVLTVDSEHIETVLGIYIGAYVLGYLGGKTADVFNNRIRSRAEEPSDVT